MRTRMSSYLPYSAMFAMFFTTVPGSAFARYSRMTLKNLLSPRPPLMSRAKKRVFMAMSLSSAKALMNLVTISSSVADLSAPAVAKRSRQKDSVLILVTAPFSVYVLLSSFFKNLNIVLFLLYMIKVRPDLHRFDNVTGYYCYFCCMHLLCNGSSRHYPRRAYYAAGFEPAIDQSHP